MSSAKDYIEDAMGTIGKLDPDEENPSYNSILSDLNLALEALRVRENKMNMLIEELKEI